ncbi:unnamed protein product [Closterium sp. Naga37s-1]|nr:unnamed protein product [Closterium sp. Naga37s-1]
MALSARLPSTPLASRATSRHHSAAELLSAAAALRAAHPFLASAASPCALTLTASPTPSATTDSDVAPFCPLFSSRRTATFVQRAGSRGGMHVARAMAEADATAAAGNGGAAGAAPVASDGDTGAGQRVARVARRTKETDVEVTIAIDGEGRCCSATGIPFLDHMMDQLASHGLLDVSVRAEGDVHIDDHHTNEDIGLALGSALAAALGDRKGVRRFGDFCAPLDEALIHVVLDLSGRPHLSFDVTMPTERVGTYDTQLVEHFFQSLVNTSGMTLHIRQLAGSNTHHIIEATFKAFARALRQATEIDPRRAHTVPSSKGVLSRTCRASFNGFGRRSSRARDDRSHAQARAEGGMWQGEEGEEGEERGRRDAGRSASGGAGPAWMGMGAGEGGARACVGDAQRLLIGGAVLAAVTWLKFATEGHLGWLGDGALEGVAQLWFVFYLLDVALTTATWIVGKLTSSLAVANCPWCDHQFTFDSVPLLPALHEVSVPLSHSLHFPASHAISSAH